MSWQGNVESQAPLHLTGLGQAEFGHSNITLLYNNNNTGHDS